MPKVFQDIPLIGATLNRSMNPVLAGGFSRMTGVDAREEGSAPKFPGFVLTTMTGSPKSNVTPDFFKAFAIQKGNLSGVLRGFVVLNTANGRITAHFYDTVDAVWQFKVIADDAGVSADDGALLDVTSSHTYLYVTYLDNSSTQVQKVFYFDGSVYRTSKMGIQNEEGWGDLKTPIAAASGKLSAGEYQVAIRLLDTRRNVRTGLSEVKTVTGISAGQGIQVGAGGGANPLLTLPTDWDSTTGSSGKTKILLYRTIADLGGLFLERQADWEGTDSELQWGLTANGGLTDLGLLRKNDPYENRRDRTGLPPTTTRIGHTQGITVMQLKGDDNEHGITDLVFSPTHDNRPEDFPRSNVYRLGVNLGNIVQFLEAGDFLVAFLESSLIRFHKQGNALSVNTFELGWGPRSRYGAVAVGSSLLVLTETGLQLVNSGDGTYLSVKAVERLVTNDWLADIKADTPTDATPNIHLSYDESLGVVFIVNNAKQEVILFWVLEGRITMLESFPWTFSATLPDPVTGGPKRAWFYAPKDNAGNFLRPDAVWSADVDRTGSNTLFGLTEGTNTLNGTLTAAGTNTQLIDTGAAWVEEIIGSFAYVFTGTNEDPNKAMITGPVDTYLVEDDLTTGSNGNSLPSDWSEVELAAADVSKVQGGVQLQDTDAGGAATFNTANWAGTPLTFSASDETYQVQATFQATGTGTGSDERPHVIMVFGRSSADMDLTADETGYLAVYTFKTTPFVLGGMDDLTQNELSIYRRDGTSSFTSLGSVAITQPAFDDQVQLMLEFNGSTIKAFFNGVEKLSVTDSTYTSGQVGFGVGFETGGNALRGLTVVNRFEVLKLVAVGTTLTLDRNITSKATSDKYTISPVEYELRMPAVGDAGRLWNRHTIEQVGAYITNLSKPTVTDNSRFRFLTFRAGSNTAETSQLVALTEDPDNLVGSLGSAHGFGIQAGLQNIEAGSSFELVAVRVAGFAQIGNTRITANT